MREDQTEAQKKAGYDFKHDVAVPVAELAALLRRCRADIEARFPEAKVVPFGHVGDGNIHMNIVLAAAAGAEKSEQTGKEIGAIIYDIVASLGGTFSAEHGIGQTKVGLLEKNRCPIEIGLMGQIKVALDNDYLMNPHKVFRRSRA